MLGNEGKDYKFDSHWMSDDVEDDGWSLNDGREWGRNIEDYLFQLSFRIIMFAVRF